MLLDIIGDYESKKDVLQKELDRAREREREMERERERDRERDRGQYGGRKRYRSNSYRDDDSREEEE